MMKKLTIVAVAVAALASFTACGNKAKKAELKTDIDSLSYAAGVASSPMMKQAMSKVRQWPDRDLFSVERQQPSGPQPDTVRLTHTAGAKTAFPHSRSGSRPPI